MQAATRAYKNGESEEMVVATLLHDDVIDDANIRRSWPSVNKIWYNKVAILIGSETDRQTMEAANKYYEYFNIDHEIKVLSAHRNPQDVHEFASNARDNGSIIYDCRATKQNERCLS